MSVKQVICINWGTKYGPLWINRLYAMVERNITPPFTFTCFTDNRDGIRPEVQCEDLPEIEADMPVGVKGKWPKSRLWGPKLGDLEGPVLFLDLDLVITGSLDALFEFGDPNDVVLTRNWNTPLEKLGQTSCYRFPVGKLLPLQEKFLSDPQGLAEEYEFEQFYVTKNAPGGVKFFPSKWILHFRLFCVWPFPLNYVLKPRLPKSARVVIFPGGIHPQHAIDGHWGRRFKPMGRWQHIKTAFTEDRGERTAFRHIRHYMFPTKWVDDHWRE